MLGKLVFGPARDHPAQRPGPEDAVLALLGEQVLGRPGHLQLDDLLGEVPLQPAQLEVDDLSDLLCGEALEDDHRVDAVEELGAEHPL
ncbi:MAG TPA: hypothetical protein VKF14_02035 [Candidatus Dormibacteraeota bacterium]|nr:hypothetical protein [Candidatus Dormibacteraeota bacterium]